MEANIEYDNGVWQCQVSQPPHCLALAHLPTPPISLFLLLIILLPLPLPLPLVLLLLLLLFSSCYPPHPTQSP